jgi:hypothetical protein
VFINAWNEWGEGCHLEPDEKHGLRHLEATRLALGAAGDLFRATAETRQPASSLSISPDRWYEVLEDVYRTKGTLSPEDLKLIAAFGPYIFFTMFPLLDKGTQDQFNLALKNKDRQIAELYDSLSWKITAPLRKIFDVFFK